MAENQVGGLQRIFVRLRSGYDIDAAATAIEEAGGRLTHAYPPRLLLAEVPPARIADLAAAEGFETATNEPITEPPEAGPERYAVGAWNEHLDPRRRLAAIERSETSMAWDSAGMQHPDPPDEIRRRLRTLEREHGIGIGAAPAAAGGINPGIPVLVGRVGVGVVFVDSTVAEFQITDAEKSKVVSEITEGLDMLSGFEPRAGIQWFYDFRRPKLSLAKSSFTEQNRDQWEDIWRNAAMGALGHSADLAGMNAYINGVKTANNAQHAYAIFVTKYPKFWFAYEWANHVVMDFTVDGWGIDNFNLVVAHETGHVFGCPDEYSSSNCDCISTFGRYQVANGNCEKCAAPALSCLMSHNSPSVCDYTRGHVGWNELAVASKGSTVLKGTWTFDLDTGIQGPAGGADLWWEQVDNTVRFLVPQNGATFRHLGSPNFDAVSYQTLQAQSYTATPINGSANSQNQLTPGSVIAIRASTGRYAKLKIESYGYNLGIRWVTYLS